MINDRLFSYLISLANDEVVVQYYEEKAAEENGKYEDETLDFLNLSVEQK